jgi:hypothetical protein
MTNQSTSETEKINTVEFDVSFTPSTAVQVNNFMTGCDLGISAITVEKTFVLTTRTEVNEEYVSRMKPVIKHAVENTGAINVTVNSARIIL